MRQSGYLARQNQRTDNYLQSQQRMIIQWMMDTVQITLHQQAGWGYDRIKDFCEAWDQTRKDYKNAIDWRHPEADVAQEHMDRVMLQIMKGKQELIPFSERYSELKKVRY